MMQHVAKKLGLSLGLAVALVPGLASAVDHFRCDSPIIPVVDRQFCNATNRFDTSATSTTLTLRIQVYDFARVANINDRGFNRNRTLINGGRCSAVGTTTGTFRSPAGSCSVGGAGQVAFHQATIAPRQ